MGTILNTNNTYSGVECFSAAELAYPGKRIQRWQEVCALHQESASGCRRLTTLTRKLFVVL